MFGRLLLLGLAKFLFGDQVALEDRDLLGNGGLGAIVTTRPDAVVIYFGHNSVWDQRYAKINMEKIGTFHETLEKIKAIPSTIATLYDDEWYVKHRELCRATYSRPYPRPMQCGAVVLW